jgi:outer membrane protein OmpA-like peptidoglycan-associated protein
MHDGDERMRKLNFGCSVFVRIMLAGLLGSLSSAAGAQSAERVDTEGVIKARDGDTMVVQTSDSPHLKVLLTTDTEVGQVQGVMKARRKEMSMAALIPGLKVKVKGTHNDQGELVATAVSFKGNDLERAETIQAGLHETQVQAEQNKQAAEQNKQAIEEHNSALQQQQQQISANKAGIDAAAARFGQLDDYYILDEVTVHFENGKVQVDQQYTPRLLQLAEKAGSVNGYVIEVKGYASEVGSKALNQQLSEDRADNVTNILVQQGHVPLTRMLAPAAMGESHQLETGDKETQQAENRRVVVRVLQNKAIAGM